MLWVLIDCSLLVKKSRIRWESEELSPSVAHFLLHGLRDGCTGGRWEVHREQSAIVVPALRMGEGREPQVRWHHGISSRHIAGGPQ